MFGSTNTAKLATDTKFRKQLLAAVEHGVAAKRRAERRIGFWGTARNLSTDEKLKRELRKMFAHLEKAWARAEKKRSHKLRNTLIVAGVGGAAVAVGIASRRRVKPRTIDESIDVNVPVSAAYNQWTQFEDFPLFMQGVDHVRQLDDTRLHWVATIAGKTHEWDAKILEQHADRQISWISEDGKKTRGTVSFEPQGDGRTLVRLSMSYQAEGPAEAIGSVAGLDAQRVRGDLKRFKELIEARGEESGAWRGEISAGQKKT